MIIWLIYKESFWIKFLKKSFKFSKKILSLKNIFFLKNWLLKLKTMTHFWSYILNLIIWVIIKNKKCSKYTKFWEALKNQFILNNLQQGIKEMSV